MTPPKPVLVLDGQSNEALACSRSLGRAGYTVFTASHHPWPLAAWSRHCRRSFRLAGQTVEAFAILRAWAHRQGVGIVLPMTERSCLLCNAERREWEAMGMTVGCAPEDILQGAFDKAETLRQAQACGVSIPPTRYPGSLAECRSAAEEVGYPCVVKPRRSNAWEGSAFLPDRGTCYLQNPSDLDAAVVARKQGDDWPLIQGFVPGEGKGIFALCDDGRAVAWFAHRRLRDVRPSGSGSSLRRAVALDERLRAPAGRLLSHLRWHGPAMVEFRDDGTEAPRLMEINGRFWTSLQLAVDAGVDFPRLWVEILEGRPIEPPGRYAEGVTLRWFWGDVKRLLHILAGPPPGYPADYPTAWQGVRELLGPQPRGTRPETLRIRDPLPAVGEWVQGITELVDKAKRRNDS